MKPTDHLTYPRSVLYNNAVSPVICKDWYTSITLT